MKSGHKGPDFKLLLKTWPKMHKKPINQTPVTGIGEVRSWLENHTFENQTCFHRITDSFGIHIVTVKEDLHYAIK